ncbi:MAG: hypothetical protein ACXV76_10865 [Halobacteriota archaeon]
MSWRVDFLLRGEKDYTTNEIRFATNEEAAKGASVVLEKFPDAIKYTIEETSDPVNFQMMSTLLPREKMTLERARELLGEENVPTEPQYREFFLKWIDDFIYRYSEEWVKEHKGLIESSWELIKTLL